MSADMRRFSSIFEVLEARADKAPDRAAFTFLKEGESVDQVLSYGKLFASSGLIADSLQRQFSPGDRMLLAFPPGLEFIKAFFACQWAGIVPVPIYQPRNNRHLDRITRMAQHVRPSAVLMQQNVRQRKHYEALAERLKLPLLSTEDLEKVGDMPLQRSSDLNEEIAFMQFTSGSTSDPKGVIVRQHQLLANLELIKEAFRQDEQSVVVGWLPHYHDMGLVGNIIQTIYSGSHSVLMSPSDFLRKPERWLRAVAHFQASTSGGPNFAYRYCAEKISLDKVRDIDLSCWKTAYCGAEPVRARTLRAFHDKFSSLGFSEKAFAPCYGMAESTLFISASASGQGIISRSFDRSELIFNRKKTASKDEGGSVSEGAVELIGHGFPKGFDLRIVNSTGQVQPDGMIGEIWVKGDSVSSGYWEMPEKTKEVFQAELASVEGSFLRTGDLGLLKEGVLYVAGRLGDQMNVRGQNIYPEDLEEVLLQFGQSDWGAVVAFPWEKSDEQGVAVALELASAHDTVPSEQVLKAKDILSSEFSIQPLEVFLVRRGILPRTTSGKIQRSECREGFKSKRLPVVQYSLEIQSDSSDIEEELSAASERETRLSEIAARVLNMPIPSADSNLISLGLDSVSMMQLVMAVLDEWEIELEIETIFNTPTVSALAQHIDEQVLKGVDVLEEQSPSRPQGPHRLSSIQTGIWFRQRLDSESTAFHIPVKLDVEEGFSQEAWELALIALLQENPILQSVVEMVDTEPFIGFRSFKPEDIFTFHQVSESEAENRSVVDRWLKQPIDLEKGPLFRALVLRELSGSSKLFMIGHHLIMDGTSILKLLSDWMAELSASRSKPSIYREDYTEFAAIEREFLGSPRAAEMRNFWLQYLDDVEPLQRFVPSKSDIVEVTGASVSKRIGGAMFDKASVFARAHGYTPFQLFFAAWVLVIHHRSKQRDILVGMPVNLRNRKEWSESIGPFLNLLFLRNRVDGNLNLLQWMERVKQEQLSAQANQQYPFDELVKDLGWAADEHAFPMTRFLINSLNFLQDDQQAKAFDGALGNAGLDLHVELNCYLIRDRDDLIVRLDYQRSVYTAEAINHLLEDFETLLASFVQEENTTIDRFLQKALASGDKQREEEVIAQSSGGVEALPEATILTLFEQQVMTAPNSISVVQGDQELTYGRLNQQANLLASRLLARGVKEGDVVPLCIHRSIEYMVAVLAVLKCGAWFVPMSIEWPSERIRTVLDKLAPKLVVISDSDASGLTSLPVLNFRLSDLTEQPANVSFRAEPTDPLYGIFTSGTTGTPKCAVNTHQGALNRFLHNHRIFDHSRKHTVLCTAQHTFDVSIWQMFWPLTIGGTAVIPVSSRQMDMGELLALIDRHSVTVSDMVPSVFNLLGEYLEMDDSERNKMASVEQLLIGGEMIHRQAVSRFKSLFPSVRLWNTYGPTETAIGTVFYEIVDPLPDPVPIGRPLVNVQAFVLNEHMRPVCAGDQGEIYLSGACVGLGYYNESERSSAVFLPHPIEGFEGEKIYKTGDWGYYSDGLLHITGRLDDQVKVNGVRIECSEIEHYMKALPEINEAITLVEKDMLLSFYIGELDESDVLKSLAAVLPSTHMPSRVIQCAIFPVNTNGKIDRQALIAMSAVIDSVEAQPMAGDGRLTDLLEVYREVLLGHSIGPNDNFFLSGGDSLRAVQLQVRIQKRFGVKLDLRTIYRLPCPVDLCRELKSAKPVLADAIPKAPEQSDHPLTPAQERIWIHERLNDTSVFNLGPLFRINRPIERENFEKAFDVLLTKQEALRAIFFANEQGMPRQKFMSLQDQELELQWYSLDVDEPTTVDVMEQARELAMRPFALHRGPLLRLSVWSGKEESYILLNIHHIVADGWSTVRICRELMEAYDALSNGRNVVTAAPDVQYRDYIYWQQERVKDASGILHQAFWKDRWDQFPKGATWPTDDIQSADIHFLSARIKEAYSKDSWKALLSEDRAEALRFFPLLLSLVAIQLMRLTGQDGHVIGVPVAGRTHEQLEPLAGYFLNILPVLVEIKPDDTLETLRTRVEKEWLAVLDHQEYPYELQMKRHSDDERMKDPVQALCLYQTFTRGLEDLNIDMERIDLDGVSGGSTYPLAYYFRSENDALDLTLEYDASQWHAQRAQMLASEFGRLLDYLGKHAQERLIDLPIDLETETMENSEVTFQFKPLSS